MAADSKQRVEGYLNNIRLLEKGIFYPQEYYTALVESNQLARLKFLKERGSFLHGFTSSKKFEIQNDPNSPTGKQCGFSICKDVVPSEALREISGGALSLLGCGEFCQIPQYQSLESIWGTEKFNHVFAADSDTPLMIGSNLEKNPILKLRNFLVWDYSSTLEFKLSDVVYITNTPSYLNKHLIGDAAGYNAICIDATSNNEKFVTLGTDKFGLSRQGILENLLHKYNMPTTIDCLTEPVKAILYRSLGETKCLNASSLRSAQLSWKDFQKEGGGKTMLLCEMNAERVMQIANCTLEKSRKLMKSFDCVRGTHRL